MINDYDDLINKIIYQRKMKDITQTQLADMCGMSQSGVARIESKKNIPTLDTVCRMLCALGLGLEIVNAK